jgi:cytochrome c oxidase subunit 1
VTPGPWGADHRAVGKRYLALGFFFLAFGGLLAMVLRFQLGMPGQPLPVIGRLLFPASLGVVPPHAYTVLFTMHGTVMIFFALTPILLGGFGSFLIPLMCGTRELAFPRLNAVSFGLLLLGGALLLSSLFVPMGAAGSGWTAYPPLSSTVGEPGAGQTLWILAMLLAGVSSVLVAANQLTTILRLRAPGLHLLRMPLTLWGYLLSSSLTVLFTPVVATALLLLLLDRTFRTAFFAAGALVVKGGGDPILYQHLFWIFGHPEVYLLILPAWGMVSDLLAFFSRKPAFGYRATVASMSAITLLSGLVYGHHMFTTGLSPMLSRAFMTLTLLISAPSAVLVLGWLGTLWRGSIRLRAPMLYALASVLVFCLGGLTGLHLGALSSDVFLHDSFFVVGHFHLTMASSILFAAFAALHFWFPKMFGRLLDETLARWHLALTLPAVFFVFGGMLTAGRAGMPRRLYSTESYEFLAPLSGLNASISLVAFGLGAAQLLLLYNVVRSLISGERAPANPWQVGTLEWTLPSPAPAGSFAVAPSVLHGPHELSNPAVKGKDWLAQDEPLPPA